MMVAESPFPPSLILTRSISMDIYTIYKATNIINGKSYIGFDSNFPERRREHKNLTKKSDINTIFHKAIIKYGWDNFDWEILYQSYDRDHTLNTMENHFIIEHNTYAGYPNGGYNLTLGGEGTFGKIKNNYKRYTFIDENANVIEIENLLDFCRKNKLSYCSMTAVACGHQKSHKGYKLPENKDYNPPDKNKIYEFIDPNGNIVKTSNLSQYSVDNNICSSSLYQVATGRIKFYKLYRNINFPDYTPKKYKVYEFISLEGKISTTNLKKFCKENNLSYSCMLDVYYSKQKSHQGYKKCYE